MKSGVSNSEMPQISLERCLIKARKKNGNNN